MWAAGNLLVEADWTVRVADFGLSRVMADLHTMASGAVPFLVLHLHGHLHARCYHSLILQAICELWAFLQSC
jgi:hypothetical protein